mmetsp:Transcript_29927/g.33547  ORF Transcript_29927/g.33547 Transcript_29927/m.33547 type:complete len:83 (-) Transcript_29927:82-330(-)
MVPLMSNTMWCSKNSVVTLNKKKETTSTMNHTMTTDDRRYNRAGTQSRYSYGTSMEKRNTIPDLLLQSNVTEEFGRKMGEKK